MTFSQTTAVKYASRSSPFSLSSASEEEEEDCGKDCSLFWAQASSLAQEVGPDLGRVFSFQAIEKSWLALKSLQNMSFSLSLDSKNP